MGDASHSGCGIGRGGIDGGVVVPLFAEGVGIEHFFI